MNIYNKPSPQECLAHHGVKGMRWGVRRYQNPDGTLTSAGRRRYQKNDFKTRRDEYKASISTGKKIVNNMLMGPFANRTYASVKVSGGSDSHALGMSIIATLLGGPLGHMSVSEIYANRAANGNSSRESSLKVTSGKQKKNISKKQMIQAYNKASIRINAELKEFNKKFDEKNGGQDWIQRLGTTSKEFKEYLETFQTLQNKYIQEELDKLR